MPNKTVTLCTLIWHRSHACVDTTSTRNEKRFNQRAAETRKESLRDGTVDDNLAVSISSDDRGRGDPRNIIGVILAEEN